MCLSSSLSSVGYLSRRINGLLRPVVNTRIPGLLAPFISMNSPNSSLSNKQPCNERRQTVKSSAWWHSLIPTSNPQNYEIYQNIFNILKATAFLAEHVLVISKHQKKKRTPKRFMLFLSLWVKTTVHNRECTWFPTQFHSGKAISTNKFHIEVFKCKHAFLDLEQISIIWKLHDGKKCKKEKCFKMTANWIRALTLDAYQSTKQPWLLTTFWSILCENQAMFPDLQSTQCRTIKLLILI